MTRRRLKPARPSRIMLPPLPTAAVKLLGVVTDPELAAQLGVSAHRIKAERRARGIAPVAAGRKPRGEVAADVSRTVKLTPAEAAAQDVAAGDRPWATWAHDTLVAQAASTPTTETP